MKTTDSNFIKRAIKYGIAMGLCFCTYTTLMWLTKLDTTYLNIGEYFDIAIVALPFSVIFIAISNEKKYSELNLIKRIGIALLVGLTSSLIYSPFLYFYHNFINPEWFDSVLSLTKAKMIAMGAEPKIIAEKIQKMKEINLSRNSVFSISAMISSVVILPLVIALLSLIFIRTRATPRQT